MLALFLCDFPSVGEWASVASDIDGSTWTPPSSRLLLRKWFSCLSGPSSVLWLAHTPLIDCRSFTLCQGKSQLGMPGLWCHTTPGGVKAGHSQGGVLGYLLYSVETCLMSLLLSLHHEDAFRFTLREPLKTVCWRKTGYSDSNTTKAMKILDHRKSRKKINAVFGSCLCFAIKMTTNGFFF